MEQTGKILAVAVGGACGAVCRYLINVSPLATLFEKFPLPTFLINITGSFVIGFLMIVLADRFAENETLRIAVIVGFLGAFTTFSTFEAEIFDLVKENQMVIALLYIMLSVVIGFVGVVAGAGLGRRMM